MIIIITLLGTLGARFLGNLLAVKDVTRAGEKTIRAGQSFQCHFIFGLILKYKEFIKLNPKKIQIKSKLNLLKIW